MTEENESEDGRQIKDLVDIDEEMRDMPGEVDFHVNGMPRKAFKRFKQLAEDEFNDYYGLTIKFLLQNYLQDMNTGRKLERMQQRIDRLESTIDQLAGMIEEDKPDKKESGRLNT